MKQDTASSTALARETLSVSLHFATTSYVIGSRFVP
jgi:hypothetical protein